MYLSNVSVDDGRSFNRPKRCVVFNIETIGNSNIYDLKKLNNWTVGEFYLQLVS